jgi:hypothetical protein
MKKLKLYFTLLIVIIIVINVSALPGCWWRDEPMYDTLFIPESMEEYVIFPVGSWWVYEDTLNHTFDTITLLSVNYTYDPFFEANNVANHVERCEIGLFDSELNLTVYKEITPNEYDTTFIYNYRGVGFSTQYKINTMNNSVFYEEYLDTIILNNKLYFGVQILNENGRRQFWVKDIGLIKNEVYSDVEVTNDSIINENLIKLEILKDYLINN